MKIRKKIILFITILFLIMTSLSANPGIRNYLKNSFGKKVCIFLETSDNRIGDNNQTFYVLKELHGKFIVVEYIRSEKNAWNHEVIIPYDAIASNFIYPHK